MYMLTTTKWFYIRRRLTWTLSEPLTLWCLSNPRLQFRNYDSSLFGFFGVGSCSESRGGRTETLTQCAEWLSAWSINKAFIDIRLRPGIATQLVVVG